MILIDIIAFQNRNSNAQFENELLLIFYCTSFTFKRVDFNNQGG